MPDALEILFEDEDLIAVNKPSGLLTEGGRGETDLEQAVSQYAGKGARACHRLDRLTSGVVLLRVSGRWRSELAEIFEGRRIRKEYWALAAGVWDRRIHRIETRIDRAENGAWANVESGGKVAVTTVQALGQSSEPCVAWLRLLLKTGRTHQARLHCKWAGCPIVGDAAYGGPNLGEGLFGLHARALRLPHPASGRDVEIVASPPSNWSEWLARLGDGRELEDRHRIL